jgi:PhnB protein
MHVTAHIVVPDAAEAAAWYAKAFGARELSRIPLPGEKPMSVVLAFGDSRGALADAFWGERHGQLTDPFGHRWNVAQRLRDVPQDEIVAAAARAFAGG